ncbi:MAG: MaoC/PaaZ C-terminal domain-containing protein [Pseudolabrys sp.]|nr:MaoC/PaaZ C-terminal domain-containing protein [Pseudolabrys sp.]
MFECHLKVGETSEFTKTITETDVAMFSAITADFDPIHVNEDYAAKSPFGKRIAHGGLVLGLLSGCASTMSKRSAERGAKAVSVSLGYDKIRFLAPVFIGDTLTARYTVEEIDPSAARSRAKIEIIKSNGELCLAGVHVMKWVVPK